MLAFLIKKEKKDSKFGIIHCLGKSNVPLSYRMIGYESGIRKLSRPKAFEPALYSYEWKPKMPIEHLLCNNALKNIVNAESLD